MHLNFYVVNYSHKRIPQISTGRACKQTGIYTYMYSESRETMFNTHGHSGNREEGHKMCARRIPQGTKSGFVSRGISVYVWTYCKNF